MIYVIKKKLGYIWIGPSKFIETDEETGSPEDTVIFIFPNWNYHDLLGCIRFWYISSGVSGGNLYRSGVIDYLETIKSLPDPPDECPQIVYSPKEEIKKFQEILRRFKDWGLIDSIPSGTIDLEKIHYMDDFFSELYRCYPKEIVDLYIDYISLGSGKEKLVLDSWSLRAGGEEEWIKKNSGSGLEEIIQFLPPRVQFFLRVSPDVQNDHKIPVPEFTNPERVFDDNIEGSVKERLQEYLKPGKFYQLQDLQGILDKISLDFPGLHLKVQDIEKYYKVERNQLYSIKIISQL